MDTHFLPSAKDSIEQVTKDINSISDNPVISTLLDSVGGLLAILNDKRQVLKVNKTFLDKLKIENAEEVLGLRTGSILKCIHTEKGHVECGTSEYCSSCGVAIALASCLIDGKGKETKCFISLKDGDFESDIAFKIKAHPIKIDSKSYILLFLHDITHKQERAILERTFFHDINNILSGLVGASELLENKNNDSHLTNIIIKSVQRLQNEMNLQKNLISTNNYSYKPEWEFVKISNIFKETEFFFENHILSKNRVLNFIIKEDILIKTDCSIIQRILCNMITNAIEATNDNSIIDIWYEITDNSTTFFVKSDSFIEEKNQLRIFQRNFTTKDGGDRGIGTFSMKYFGEKLLGGKVSFTSSISRGTIFKIKFKR